MTRAGALLGTFVFLLLVPGAIAGVVPWWLSGWEVRPPFLGLAPLRVAGVVLVLAGVAALLESFARFALRGLGTPAPVLPTKYLVVSGLYRHVRNPMYVGVVAVILGQALLLGAAPLLGYAALVWLVVHVFVVGYEEPKLRATFGAKYDAFRANVPRWIPRVRPWRAR